MNESSFQSCLSINIAQSPLNSPSSLLSLLRTYTHSNSSFLLFHHPPPPPLRRPMSATSAATELCTPTLDAESSQLLQSISSHGGYAYVSMATLAAAGDFRAAEGAREMAWEQLHSGPWHSVIPVWRDAYSMACLHVAKFHYRNGELKEALRVLDMGLIMGGLLLREDLESCVEVVSGKSREKGVESEGLVKKDCKFVEEVKFDKGEVRVVSDSLHRVKHVLPVKSLSCKIVPKRSGLSLEGILQEYFQSGTPVIICDCMAHWPARTKWNDMEYLKWVAGDRTVPVEVGKNYLCPEWKQELITFSEFFERMKSKDCSTAGVTYLAQHQLFDQINELLNDICFPEYCFAAGGELRSINAWFGPAGTVTPLHHDPHHNILAQVDLDNIDETKFPKVLCLDFFDCILEEGEMLYVPPKWWHYVRSLTTSFSVSFCWSKSEDSAAS